MDSSRKWLLGGALMTAITLGLIAPCQAGELPQSVVLDSLAELYDGVAFDHAMHKDLVQDCAACHHHTTGTAVTDEACAGCHGTSKGTEVVACRECHPAQPFSAEYLAEKEQDIRRYHTDKPGLKAAYHLNCLGCHTEAGGPTGCEDCHSRNAAGEAFYRSGTFAPKGGGGAGHGH